MPRDNYTFTVYITSLLLADVVSEQANITLHAVHVEGCESGTLHACEVLTRPTLRWEGWVCVLRGQAREPSEELL